MSREIGTDPYTVQVDCESCGRPLGFLLQAANGELLSVNPRTTTTGSPRLTLNTERDKWQGDCRCGALTQVRDDRLRKAVAAVSAAGLGQMPFRGLS